MFAIVYSRNNKRVRDKNGELTPVFEYPIQALKYIDYHLGGSPYVTIKKVGENKK